MDRVRAGTPLICAIESARGVLAAQEIVVQEVPEQEAVVPDLMAALEQSLTAAVGKARAFQLALLGERVSRVEVEEEAARLGGLFGDAR